MIFSANSHQKRLQAQNADPMIYLSSLSMPNIILSMPDKTFGLFTTTTFISITSRQMTCSAFLTRLGIYYSEVANLVTTSPATVSQAVCHL